MRWGGSADGGLGFRHSTILIYVDWVPQVNGPPNALSVWYRESSVWQSFAIRDVSNRKIEDGWIVSPSDRLPLLPPSVGPSDRRASGNPAVHHAPYETGQLARHRDGRLVVVHSAQKQLSVYPVQPPVGPVRIGDDRGVVAPLPRHQPLGLLPVDTASQQRLGRLD